METSLEDQSASVLRKILIEEVKSFIKSLDSSSADDLDQKKLRLKAIVHLLDIKEPEEMKRIFWGKNSTQPPTFIAETDSLQRNSPDLPV